MPKRATRSILFRYATPVAEYLTDLFAGLEARWAPLAMLAIRLWLAQAFMSAGVLNAGDPEPTIWLFTFVYPVAWITPETATAVLIAVELIAPVFLIIGLLSRLAALPLLLVSGLLFGAYPAVIEHGYHLVFLGLIILLGPGAISLDRKFASALARSALPLAAPAQQSAGWLSRYAGPVYMALLRVWTAALFVPATAIAPIETFRLIAPITGSFGEMATDSAWLTGLTTIGAPGLALLLAAGFLTRIAAFLLAALVVLVDEFYFDLGGHGLCLFLLAWLVARGPGTLSLDRLAKARCDAIFPGLDPSVEWLDKAPRVVIVGGGFAGIAAALGLKYARAQVTLIDRHNYHLFQPLLYQVATALLSPADIATPIRSLMRGRRYCRVILGEVTGVDRAEKTVSVDGRSVPFDYLVLATGARHSYFGQDEWEPYAPGLKRIDDATAVRRRILLAFEKAEQTDDSEDRARLMTFVIIGGGPTGVELAGAIAELARHGLAGEFHRIDPADAKVILVQSASRLLPAMPKRLSENAKQALEALGVDVRLDSRVEAIDEEGARVGEDVIAAGTAVWAAGVAASPAGEWLDADCDKAGRVIVGPALGLPDDPDIFVVGDTACCEGADGKPLPGLAAVAKQQGTYVARVIRARIENLEPPGRFRYRDYGVMATIGRDKAVADLRGLRLSGTLAWWLWSLVHVAFLADIRNRLSVMLDWTWSYLTFARRIRLITGSGDR